MEVPMRLLLFVTLAVGLFSSTVAMAQDIGDPCIVNEQCESNFCADGFCCDDTCGDSDPDDDLACSVEAGSSADGFCEMVGMSTGMQDAGQEIGTTPVVDEGGGCSSSVASHPIKSPGTQTLLMLLLVGLLKKSGAASPS